MDIEDHKQIVQIYKEVISDYKQIIKELESGKYRPFQTIDMAREKCGLTQLPKEKTMENKVIFESEEQFIEMLRLCLYWPEPTVIGQSIINNAKSYGYIRKSVVEEAEEMYKKWIKLNENEVRYNREQLEIMLKLYKAIQYLKSENERLKK